MIILERGCFKRVVKKAVAEEISSQELLVFESTGDPHCCPEVEIFVAAPRIDPAGKEGRWQRRKRTASKEDYSRVRIKMPQFLLQRLSLG
jgi:hypothetical protein